MPAVDQQPQAATLWWCLRQLQEPINDQDPQTTVLAPLLLAARDTPGDTSTPQDTLGNAPEDVRRRHEKSGNALGHPGFPGQHTRRNQETSLACTQAKMSPLLPS